MTHHPKIRPMMRARDACVRLAIDALAWRAAAALVAAIALAGGCSKDHAASTASSSSSQSTDGVALGDLAQTADLDAHYLIGPSPARKLDYRIDWQTRTDPFDNSGVKLMTVQDDSIFLLDGENFLSRLRRDNGARVWRLAIAEQFVEVQGMRYLPEIGRIYVAAGSNMLVLDSVTGAQTAKQHLEQVANTDVVVRGPMMIYGSRTGQLVWHTYGIGTMWKAYQIASSIQVTPALIDDKVVVVGAGGRIAVVDGASASMIWNKTLLDNVVAAPAVGNGHVYVAGLDQHLWAFDVESGQTIWRHLTESTLTESPVLIGDRLYQQIPVKGLVCFEAAPANSPGGKVIWTGTGVTGSVVNGHRGLLMVWDADKKLMSLVSAARGNLIDTVPLGRIKHLYCSSLTNGEIYAAGNDGTVIRLTPRN